VVTGDTLWDLAQTYYSNPFDWRRIWEANRSQITDPNLILPGQVLTIPDRQAEVRQVTVETPGAETQPAEAPAPRMGPEPSMADQPTIFRSTGDEGRGMVMSTVDLPYLAVSRSQVYSAPWLVRMGDQPESSGVLESFAGGPGKSNTPRAFNKVRLSFPAGAPAVGTELQVFRVAKTIPDVGQVVTPTAVVTISDVDEGGAVGVITKEFGRIALGDLVGPLPSFRLTTGQYAQPVSGGPQAMVMGFAGLSVLQDMGEVAFLDQGRDDGVAVGDEYELRNPDLGSDAVEGVTHDGAAARIIQMDDAVFRQGVVVQLTRKMR
jgi:hypothetical protein